MCISGAKMHLSDDLNTTWGLCSSMFAECSKCGLRTFFRTGYGDPSKADTRQSTDVNRRLFYAACETGISREGLATLCEIMNMPPPPAHADPHYDAILSAHKRVIDRLCMEARAKVRELKLKEMGLPTNDDETFVDAGIHFDGTWSKRGFTAIHGIGFIISVDTGEVLDYYICSKYCSKCKYDEGKQDGCSDCRKNFCGSSPAMERECAKAIWESSLTNGSKIRYTSMVTDGDSKAYSDVWDIYGVCPECNEFEKATPDQMQGKRYNNWYKSHFESDQKPKNCHRVYKVDCIGHICKRMGTALRDIQKTKGKLSDGGYIKGKSGRLTKTAIKHLQDRYANAIRSNSQGTSIADEKVKKMQTAILAVLYHSTKITDQKLRHKYCPDGSNSWCKYKRGEGWTKEDDKPHHLDPVFLDILLPTFQRLGIPSLLLRCISGSCNNPSESINSINWARNPKHKWAGPIRIEIGAISSMISFNKGAAGRILVMNELGLAGGFFSSQHVTKLDKRRIYHAKLKVKRTAKRYQAKLAKAKAILEKARIRREGTSYGAGLFNDASCHVPSRRGAKNAVRTTRKGKTKNQKRQGQAQTKTKPKQKRHGQGQVKTKPKQKRQGQGQVKGHTQSKGQQNNTEDMEGSFQLDKPPGEPVKQKQKHEGQGQVKGQSRPKGHQTSTEDMEGSFQQEKLPKNPVKGPRKHIQKCLQILTRTRKK